LLDFFEQIKEDPKTLNKYTTKEQAEKITKILESKKDKPKEIRQIFKISSQAPDGIITIKKIIQTANKNSKSEISYLAAGKYRINLKGEDFKKIKTEINSILEEIETKAKKLNCKFELEKAKH